MKITDLRCIHIPAMRTLLLRIDTDEGVYGLSQAEANKHSYLAPQILYFRQFITGLDPTNVEDVMRRIRRLGSFKPWGGAVSSIEIALWDLAGKAAGLPAYKLLGGKVRDTVAAYMGGPPPLSPPTEYFPKGCRPEDFAESARKRTQYSAGMRLAKFAIGFHNPLHRGMPGYHYGIVYPPRPSLCPTEPGPDAFSEFSGMISDAGLAATAECVEAIREGLGDEMGMALDCGPGWKVPGAIALARRIEHTRPMWLEDLITGDYVPYVNAEVFREIRMHTSIPIHTGEQIYHRQNFKELIETRAVDVLGPDPMDVGGLAEMKWITEYADLHGILMAPHGIGDGPFGLAAMVQLCATLPDNFIAFELPMVVPEWKNLLKGIETFTIEDGVFQVPDRPGLGLDIVEEEIQRLLGRDNIYTDYTDARLWTPDQGQEA